MVNKEANTSDISDIVDSSSYEPRMNFEQLKNLKNLPRRQHDTGGSQGFASRLGSAVRNIYEKSNLLPEPLLMLFIGAFMGSSLTLHNLEPNYRIDKSPTSNISSNIAEWYKIEKEDLIQYTDLKDQPKYSHNEIYQLAKKIGFPTNFKL